MRWITKIVVSGLVVGAMCLLVIAVGGPLVPLLFVPGSLVAIAIIAVFNPWLEPWLASEGIDPPTFFAALAGLAGIPFWWVALVCGWTAWEVFKKFEQRT